MKALTIPKYSKLENERRWLLPSSFISSLKQLPYKKIDDLYLSCGRLRLRAITDSQTGQLEFKLCKKYGAISETCEPIVNVYLTVEEYGALSVLPGHKLSKSRYKKVINNVQYGFDVFEGTLSGLILCEVEAESEDLLKKISSPDLAAKEVTGNSVYSGGHLCVLNTEGLKELLK